jgi:hypothetical protein
MNDWREGSPNPVPQLLVIEAIREFEAHFADCPEKASLIATEIGRLGRKPGFAVTAQLLRSIPDPGDTLKDITDFLAGRFSVALFDIQAVPGMGNNTIKIKYGDRLPAWFTPLTTPQGEVLEQAGRWFNGFADFMVGLFSGALLHFGYRLIGPASYEFTTGALTFTFRAAKLDAVWEFGGNFHA